MPRYIGPIEEEIGRLLHTYCSMDPKGLWDEVKWEAYAQEHASDKLKRYIKRKGKNWLYSGGKSDFIIEGTDYQLQTSEDLFTEDE